MTLTSLRNHDILSIMEEGEYKKVSTATDWVLKGIIKADVVLHVIVALSLIASCVAIVYFSMENLLHLSRDSVLHVINDMLLVLIILELLWTVIRFLKKQKFILGPFLSIGIIASLRRILLIEAQTSMMEHVPVEKLYEIALSAGVVLVLMIAYYIEYKTRIDQD